MRAAWPLLPVLLSLGAGCVLPERDNPADPVNLTPPDVHVWRMQTFNCRQWLYPLVEGHNELVQSNRFTERERAEVEEFCEAVCPGVDPGGPPADPTVPWTPNACHQTLVYAGVVDMGSDLTAVCAASQDAPRSFSFSEHTLRTDGPATADVVAFARTNRTVPVGVLATVNGDESDLRIVAIPEDPERPIDAGYDGVETFMTPSLRAVLAGGVLLTRRTDVVDRLEITAQLTNAVLEDGDAAGQRSACNLSMQFDQAFEVHEHPLGMSGGYGRRVAIGNLDMEGDGAATGDGPFEIATSYSVGTGTCYVDLIYRDRLTRPRHWGFDGNAPIGTACGPDGAAPAIAIGPFLDPGTDALAVAATAGSSVEFWSAIGEYAIAPVDSLGYTEIGPGPGPAELADVGDQNGDGRSELAVVTSDRSSVLACMVVGSGGVGAGCAALPLSDCAGGSVTRIVSVAQQPYGLETGRIAAAVQSTANTCVFEWAWAGSGTDFTLAEQSSFPGRPTEAKVHWVAEQGVATAFVVGTVNASEPTSVVHEVDPNASPARTFPLVTSSESCSTPLGGGHGVGASGALVPDIRCGSAACSYDSGRLIGMPDYDAKPAVAGGAVIEDAGAIGWFDGSACDNGAYVLETFQLPGVLPTGYGAAIEARPERRRARRETSSAASNCRIPATIAIGAPSAGPFGGAGHLVVLYPPAADPANPTCTDVAWP